MNTTYSVGEQSPPMKKLSFSESSSEEEEAASSTEKLVTKSARARKLTYADMVVSAVQNIDDPKGATLPSIKNYLKEQYRIDEAKLRRYLKQSMQKCLDNQEILRCNTNSSKPTTTGLRGRFRLNSQKQKKASSSAKKMKISLPSSKRKSSISPVAVDKSKLKSLRGKSKQLERAQQMVKDARDSLAFSGRKDSAVKSRVTRGKAAASAKTPSSTSSLPENVEAKKSRKKSEKEKSQSESTKTTKEVKKSSAANTMKKVAKKKPPRKMEKSGAKDEPKTSKPKAKSKASKTKS